MPVIQPAGAITTLAIGAYVDAIFSADGSIIYAVLGNNVSVIQVATGGITANYTIGNQLGAIALSQDARYLAIVEEQSAGNGILHRLDLTSGNVSTFHLAGTAPLHDVAFLANGDVVVSQEVTAALRTFNFATGNLSAVTISIPGNATLTVSEDGNLIIATPPEITWPLYSYNVLTGTVSVVLGQPDPYAGASVPPSDNGIGAISPDGSLIVHGISLEVYNNTFSTSFSLKNQFPYLRDPQGMTFSPDGASLFLALASGQIIHFSTASWTVVAVYPIGAMPTSSVTLGYGDVLQVNTNGTFLSVIGSGGLQLIDLTKVQSIAGPGTDTLNGPGPLFGFGGDDILGGESATTMFGGMGADTYYVTASGDRVLEYAGQGRDLVHSNISYALPSHVDDLVLDGANIIDGTGNELDNLIVGNLAANQLHGGGGNDTLHGNAGDDTLIGGEGNDHLDGGDGADRLIGNGGNDMLDAGGGSANWLIGNSGSDTLNGGAGYDRLFSGEESTVFSGDGLVIDTGTEIDTLLGGGQSDFLFAGYGDNVDGGDNGDYGDYLYISFLGALSGVTVDFRQFSQVVGGGTITNVENITWVQGSNFDDTINAGSYVNTGYPAGFVEVRGMGGNDHLVAGFYTGAIWGGNGDDIIDLRPSAYSGSHYGEAGNDTIIGSNGYETLDGGEGDDVIHGNAGFDDLLGGAGNDTLDGGSFGDSLWGGNGDDMLFGAGDADMLDGGAGNDILYGDFSPLGSTNQIIPQSNNDVLVGGAGSDRLYGDQGNDTLNGGSENDMLSGGTGTDQLYGDGGGDMLTGDAGSDSLTGGGGADTFRDTAAGLSGDTITDLALGETIVITDASFANFSFVRSGSTITYTGGSLNLGGMFSGHLVASAASGGGVQLTLQAIPDVRNDFNGDGRSDILWRHDSGLLTEWLGQANGGFVDNGANAVNNIASSWSVTGTGDFNGDGRDDILWRHDSGLLTEWLGQANGGFTDNGANAFHNIASSWQVTGTGDFNGDGRDDILWRHDSGLLTEWLGQANGGFTDNGANAFHNIATSWSVTGTGDFNGDGRDDILWRHTSGLLTEWLGTASGGFTDNGANAFNNIASSWSVTGVGDFNGDGRDDILWRHETGLLTSWLGQANGGFVDNGANAFHNIASSWSVTGIGDFNGDGRDDILWRHDTGLLTEWLGTASGGFADNGANAFHNIASSWQVQPEASIL